MKLENFETDIEELPEEYANALKTQTERVIEVKNLEFEIFKLEQRLRREESNPNELNEDSDEEVIILEADVEKLKLKLSETECKLELTIRIENGKITESHVKALVSVDENVSKLRNELIEAKAKIKLRKSEIQRNRSEIWEKKRLARITYENDELIELKNNLRLAKNEQMKSDDEVEILRMKIDLLREIFLVASAHLEKDG